jgi:hypothetical protein
VEPSFSTYGGYDAVLFFKQCVEDLKLTGDPAKLAEERLALRDWFNNPPNDGKVMGSFGETRVVNGLRMDPAFLFTVHEDPELGGILIDPYECPEEYWETHPYPTLEPYTEQVTEGEMD